VLSREYLEQLLEAYLLFRICGGPSPTARLDNASPSGSNPPVWLMAMIEIGVALDALLDAEREAVRKRFNAMMARDDEIRYATVAHHQQLAAQRQRDTSTARHWKAEEKKAWNEYARQDRKRQLFERTREYARGMDRLARMLGGE
jgi:hypothetical protein